MKFLSLIGFFSILILFYFSILNLSTTFASSLQNSKLTNYMTIDKNITLDVREALKSTNISTDGDIKHLNDIIKNIKNYTFKSITNTPLLLEYTYASSNIDFERFIHLYIYEKILDKIFTVDNEINQFYVSLNEDYYTYQSNTPQIKNPIYNSNKKKWACGVNKKFFLLKFELEHLYIGFVKLLLLEKKNKGVIDYERAPYYVLTMTENKNHEIYDGDGYINEWNTCFDRIKNILSTVKQRDDKNHIDCFSDKKIDEILSDIMILVQSSFEKIKIKTKDVIFSTYSLIVFNAIAKADKNIVDGYVGNYYLENSPTDFCEEILNLQNKSEARILELEGKYLMYTGGQNGKISNQDNRIYFIKGFLSVIHNLVKSLGIINRIENENLETKGDEHVIYHTLKNHYIFIASLSRRYKGIMDVLFEGELEVKNDLLKVEAVCHVLNNFANYCKRVIWNLRLP